MGGFGISILSAFVYRLAAITNSLDKLHNKFSITMMILIHLFYATPVYIPASLSYFSQYSKALEEVKTVNIKCLRLILGVFRNILLFMILV
jgi:hypothetical protein